MCEFCDARKTTEQEKLDFYADDREFADNLVMFLAQNQILSLGGAFTEVLMAWELHKKSKEIPEIFREE